MKAFSFLARNQALNSVVRDRRPVVHLLEQMQYTIKVNGYRHN